MSVSWQPDPIGTGPASIVHSGLRDGVPVVLKVFPVRFDRHTVAAFEKERARLASVADVSPILPVQGIDLLTDGRHALVMEPCAQSLATLLRTSGPLSPDDAVVLGYALALALTAAHSAGVVHGAVHPNNVLFRASGEPVLADFGVVLRHALSRDPLHAIEFQPPETVRDQTLDERTDLYGLGAVLHYALTGHPPHPGRLGEQPGERVWRVLHSPVPAINRPDVPVPLSTVVARMLAADPAHRPPDAASVAQQLSALLPHPPEPLAKPPDPPPVEFDDPSPVTPGPARRYLIIGGIVLAAALIVTMLLVLLLPSSSEELSTSPRVPPTSVSTVESAAPAAVQLELAEPTDLGDQVVLNWTAAPNLDFAVIVSPEGGDRQTLLAERNHTLRVPIDPNRRYCFQVQATDKLRVYTSTPKSLHGATCPG